MAVISKIHAREVLDSRGNPTVEVDVHCTPRGFGRAIVPSGASTGEAEAHELRDGDAARYGGKGVLRAVENVNDTISPAVTGFDPADQASIDARLLELDGTPNKSRLGANAILGVSLAVVHSAADAAGTPLYHHLNGLWSAVTAGDAPPNGSPRPDRVEPRMPLPMTNMISGGLHAGGNLDFQDVLIVPGGARSYGEALEWIVRVSRRLGERLTAAGYEGYLVGDEGGYGPRLESNHAAIGAVVEAIAAAGLRPGDDVTIALDVASTHFYEDGHYRLAATGEARLDSRQMIDHLAELAEEFPISLMEDGLAEEDWEGWQEITPRLGGRMVLVGDDLFATNPARLQYGIDRNVANAVLVKVNQIGTLTETLATMRLAESHGYRRVVSARSGETEDTTIADLAVGTAADYIKIGSIQRSERLAKYNQLLRLEEQLGADCINW